MRYSPGSRRKSWSPHGPVRGSSAPPGVLKRPPGTLYQLLSAVKRGAGLAHTLHLHRFLGPAATISLQTTLVRRGGDGMTASTWRDHAAAINRNRRGVRPWVRRYTSVACNALVSGFGAERSGAPAGDFTSPPSRFDICMLYRFPGLLARRNPCVDTTEVALVWGPAAGLESRGGERVTYTCRGRRGAWTAAPVGVGGLGQRSALCARAIVLETQVSSKQVSETDLKHGAPNNWANRGVRGRATSRVRGRRKVPRRKCRADPFAWAMVYRILAPWWNMCMMQRS